MKTILKCSMFFLGVGLAVNAVMTQNGWWLQEGVAGIVFLTIPSILLLRGDKKMGRQARALRNSILWSVAT